MPELPTGTVTFLFTDIEGSTRLLQELGEGYRETRVALSSDEYERAWAEGYAMTMDQAVALALEGGPPPPP